MQNEFLNEFTPAESIKQVSQYFKTIDNAVSVGDTNRKYSPSKNAGSPGGEQREGNFITFNISPVGENMCDLYNSFISATMNLTVKNSATVSQVNANTGCNAPAVWIGFKDAFDSVSAYQLFANGRQIYSQDNAHEESFVIACGSTEAIKTVDVFSKARHEDVWRRADTVKSGAVIDLNNKSANSTTTVSIPIKIDIRKFLVLDSVRYLPAFAGNMQLKVKFSSEALQVAPLSIEDICNYSPANIKALTTYPAITNKFVPFETQFTMITGFASSNGAITLTSATQSLSKVSCTIDNTFSYLNSFSLDANVYNELVEHYTTTALCFPIKRIDWMPMEGSVNNTTGAKSVFTATYTPLFVNSIFALFKKDSNYYCNYENPLFDTIQLNCGAYGNIPAEPEKTTGPVFYEMCANSLNTNNDLCGFNTDVMRSLTANAIEATGYRSNDTTNFFIGFPTETDFTFQQGMTSNSPITFKLTTTSSSGTFATTEKPMIGFLKHVCLSIQVASNGPPAVVIDDFDLSQPNE